MFYNNFKVAWRSLTANRFFSVVNISGLTIGLTAVILIFLWVQNELTFDRDIPHGDRMYRLISHIDVGSDVWHWGVVPLMLNRHATTELPEIEELVMLRTAFHRPVVELENGQVLEEEDLAYVDQGWLDEFYYRIKEGSTEDFYQRVHSLALTQDLADKYFGKEDALGKIVRIDSIDYQVNLILEDNPVNSNFQFKAFIPLESRWSEEENRRNDHSWGNFDFLTFVRLADGVDPTSLATKMTQILERNRENNQATISLEALSDVRFSHVVQNDVFEHGNKATVQVFALIGLFILIIAGLNYTNLSTALVSRREKEIGIKKIVGASFGNIFTQIILESFIISFASFLLAVAAVILILPYLGEYISVRDDLITQPLIWVMLLGILLINVLIAGLYPAWTFGIFKARNFMARNNPSRSLFFRKAMVACQFVLTIAMLSCAVIVQQQLSYIQDKDVGYDRTQVLEISPNMSRGDWRKNYSNLSLYADEMRKLPEIKGLTAVSGSIINIRSLNSGNFSWEGKDDDFDAPVATFSVDDHLMSVFNLPMKRGRWFDPDLPTDRNHVILNETAIKKFQIPEPVVGIKTNWRNVEGEIIGVVKDFHFRGMREDIQPLLISTSSGWHGTILVRLDGHHVQTAIAKAEKKFADFFPHQPFHYTFLDESYQKMHESEARMGFLFKVFAAILVFISCLGLFGLTTFAVHRRTKEIGIRKVLGATATGIVGLLSRDFLRLIVISAFLAIPFAWFSMSKWLQDFSYRIQIQWWMFLLAGISVIVMAILSTGVQSVRAALSNPVNSLRVE